MKSKCWTAAGSLFALLIALLCISLSAYAQTAATQTPKPADETDVVKISTTLVQLDVTVTDKKGNIITDLKPEDFEIFENGEKRDITNFSFVTNGNAPSPVKNRQPNLPLKPEQVRRTIALIVDDLTISWEKFGYVKKSLQKFVDEQMRDGDFVAIARTGGSIGILQQFTSDRRQLSAAIRKLRWNPLGLGVRPDSPEPLDTGEDKASGAIAVGADRTARDPSKEADDFRKSSVTANLIGGINYFVSGMRDLPGRKSAIIFSEGFKIIKRDLVGPERDFRVNAALEKLFDAAARASVVVNTIDVRGLEPDRPDIQEFNDQQDGLVFMAQQTGGTTVSNGNDFNLGIEKILGKQQSYYLLAYDPGAFDADKRHFNKYIIKVKREGATVNYRQGFFSGNALGSTEPSSQTPTQRLMAALVAPFAANDISLNLNALFSNDVSQGSFVRSLLNIKADDLKFTDGADGSKTAVFDVLAVTFNGEGTSVDKIAKNYILTLPEKEYRKLLAEGLVYYFTFPVKKPGAYQFRVVILDKQSEKIGSASEFIEIPDLKNKELALSGIVLENLSPEQWQRQQLPPQLDIKESATQGEKGAGNPLSDTSLKRFKRNTILRYAFEIYNAKLSSAQKPQLTTQIKVFREGNLVLAGKPASVDLTGQTDWNKVTAASALSLGDALPLGEYILQITVTDNSMMGKTRSTVQSIQFEII